MSINEDTSREELEDNETVIANAESIVHQYKASSVLDRMDLNLKLSILIQHLCLGILLVLDLIE